MNVAILGASANPERFSHRAQKLLAQHGHDVIPVTLDGGQILGVASVRSLNELSSTVHTVTLYLRPGRQGDLAQDLLDLSPQRVIFNPGTENPALEQALLEAGIEVVRDCTLVMLRSGRFDSHASTRA